jgi:diguanylate cyclase (GGDEF)-like protein/PAS domain S-box-containing protein
VTLKDRGSLPRTIGTIISVVFIGEFVVMMALDNLPMQLSSAQEGLLDAVMLTIVCSVALWMTLAKPLRAAADAEVGKFDLLMEAVPDGVIGVDETGHIRLVNERIETLFQYDRDELIGGPLEMLIPDRFVESYVRHRNKYFAAPRLRAIAEGKELVGRRADGSEIPVEISLNSIQTPDGLLVLGSIRDVSDQRQAHVQLLEANRRLNTGLHDLERSSEELRRLSDLGELLQGCVTEQEAHTIIGRVMPRQLPFASGGVYLISASRNMLQLSSSWGEQAETLIPTLTPDDCWALRRGRVHAAQDNQSTIQCAHINPQHDGYLCIPMMAQGELLGILHVFIPSERKDSEGDSDTEECKLDSKRMLLFAVSEQIGLALANLRLREELKRQSIRDSLTGLFNRRFMEESLDREMLRASETGCPLSLAVIDLDHFKNFNDSFGHEGGDLVLREIGALLREQRSGSDLACRMGGEELAMILPDATVEDAAVRAEAIRQRIEGMAIMLGGRPLGKITASFGIAGFPSHGSDYQQILRAADGALYRAKAAGRNRVVVAEDAQTSSAESVGLTDSEIRSSANDAA